MTATGTGRETTDEVHVTVARHNPHRWRLSRAGFVDVWQYYDNEFDLSAGRGILRGPNGSGKSRALEMLLPFLLDADRRNMPTATPVTLEDLMARGLGDRTNRQGHMWLELRRTDEQGEARFYTLGACLRYSATSRSLSASYYTTEQRVGHQLTLKVDDVPLSRGDLTTAVGPDRVTDSPRAHRDRVRVDVFGLTGDSGKERFDGLLRLLHTLRDPGVGDRIESGALPLIVSRALPPLSETSLADAGHALDNLTSTRDDLESMRDSHAAVEGFLDTYRRWLTGAFAGLFDYASRGAARAVEDRTAASDAAAKVQLLDKQVTAAKNERDRHHEASQAAAARAETLKSSPRYKALTELGDKRRALTFAESAADGALTAAHDHRDIEIGAVSAANDAADNVTHELDSLDVTLANAHTAMTDAALLGHELPRSVTITRRPTASRTDVVRVELHGEPVTMTYPTPDTLEVSVVLDDVKAAARTAENAAEARRGSAATRATQAQRLDRAHQQLAADQRAADSLAENAATGETAADLAETARDDAARALAVNWTQWTARNDTVELLRLTDWAAVDAVSTLLTDPEVLVGDWNDEPISLAQLSRAASAASEPARSALAAQRAHVDAEQTVDDHRERELSQRRQRLLEHHDESPPHPYWQQPIGVQLWQVTDFAADLDPASRAGLEAALLGAGALTAIVDVEGSLVAAEGDLLVTPGEQADQPLSQWLEADAAGCLHHEVDTEAVAAILASIHAGTGPTASDKPAGLTVNSDGTWHNGPLAGRHPVSTARHIGAAARAAERAVRIDEIGRDLADLSAARVARREQLTALAARAAELTAHVGTAPASTIYGQARATASAKRQAAFEARSHADTAQTQVTGNALTLRSEREQHRQACDAADLPTDADGLRAAEQRSAAANAACQTVPGAVQRLAHALRRWAEQNEHVHLRTRRRHELEQLAAAAWSDWQTAHIEYVTLEQIVGDSGRDLHREVRDLDTETGAQRQRATEAAARHIDLTGRHGSATAEANTATATASASEQTLSDTATALRGKLILHGVADTLYIDSDKAQTAREAFADPGTVARDASKLSSMLRRARTGDAQLHNEERVFAANVGATFDLHIDLVDGIWLYELSDSDGRRPLAAAATELGLRYAEGQKTLTERDTAIFTDYLLGEVGDELRRRIGQAETLVADMQRSLATIRTSHDVQVKIRWILDEDADEDIRAIDRLVRVAQQMRNREQDAELVRLLRERVIREAMTDPSAGYTDHLQKALDYRVWHRVEVLAEAPHIGRTKVSGKSKLSQGELRTVSYVTLFAAVDAYVSSLGDDRALRLALLDDAFAKVDANSIGQMMGLLVNLDIDFLLTGHDLWGCFPTVPALDVYTILRREDGPAVAQHTHWDGHGRHLRVP